MGLGPWDPGTLGLAGLGGIVEQNTGIGKICVVGRV